MTQLGLVETFSTIDNDRRMGVVAGVGTVLLLGTEPGLGFVGKLGSGNRGGDGSVGLSPKSSGRLVCGGRVSGPLYTKLSMCFEGAQLTQLVQLVTAGRLFLGHKRQVNLYIDECLVRKLDLSHLCFSLNFYFSYVSSQFLSMFSLLTYSHSFFSLSADYLRHSRQRRSKIRFN